MTTNAVEVATQVAAVAHDMSPWGLFMQADLIVKTVILLLVFMSVWCWTIVIEKSRKFKQVNAAADAFEEKFWAGRSMEDLYDAISTKELDPMSAVFAAAMREWRRSRARGVADESRRTNLKARIERVMNITLNRELDRLEKHLIVLASTGSAAPFIGLFGTVWGIMNSFTAIAATNTTALSAVAPGIAEALFATAIGLVAAIPAVIAYNKYATELTRFSGRLETFSGEFIAIVSRQLDEAN